jgi:hypothetical protein
MIDVKLFKAEALVATLLDARDNKWRNDAEILQEDRRGCQIWVVRVDRWYLRYSAGPKQGHFWDAYGEDYLSPELALLALVQAPVPPSRLAWPEQQERS